MKQLLSVQYLRAIAALLVVLCHTFQPNQTNFHEIWGSLFEFGGSGVDIFFVLSGFIMAYIIPNESNPIVFLKKRMARIYPTYWQVYFLAILSWLIFRGIFKIPFMQHGSWFVNLSLLPFEFDGDNTNMVLGAAWTLYYEIVFYMIVTLILYFFPVPKHGIYLFFFSLFFLPDMGGFQTKIFFEFIAGFLLVELMKKNTLLDLMLVIGCVIALHFFKVREIAYVPVTLTLAFLSIQKQFPEFKLLKRIGDSSYSLYLIHLPLIGLGNAICGLFSGVTAVLFLITWLCLIVYLSLLNYEYFEKRVARKLKPYLTSSPSFSLNLCKA